MCLTKHRTKQTVVKHWTKNALPHFDMCRRAWWRRVQLSTGRCPLWSIFCRKNSATNASEVDFPCNFFAKTLANTCTKTKLQLALTWGEFLCGPKGQRMWSNSKEESCLASVVLWWTQVFDYFRRNGLTIVSVPRPTTTFKKFCPAVQTTTNEACWFGWHTMTFEGSWLRLSKRVRSILRHVVAATCCTCTYYMYMYMYLGTITFIICTCTYMYVALIGC